MIEIRWEAYYLLLWMSGMLTWLAGYYTIRGVRFLWTFFADLRKPQ